jgi:mannose-6-phosphate isomerase
VDARAETDDKRRTIAGLSQYVLMLEPQFRERVWGGQRLRAADPPIGEAWLAMGDSVVANGPLAGRKVKDLAAEMGADFLGTSVAARYGVRFPLLAKILDCADWLSVQVHPNDEQARRMVGPGEFGKTEAWYFLEAEPEARIMIGVKPGISAGQVVAAIREGRVVEIADQVEVQAGDAVLIPAGTLHALGPGLLLYEIQQESDTTYRAFDWGRPQTGTRKLHIDESAAVTTTEHHRPIRQPVIEGGSGTADAVECEYFDLDLVRVGGTHLPLDTGQRSFHIITVIDGVAEVSVRSERVRLEKFQTAIVAGATGQYRVCAAEESATLLRASVSR